MVGIVINDHHVSNTLFSKTPLDPLERKITKGGEVLALDNMSPLLDYHDDVVVFMGAGDIQKQHAFQ